MPPKRKQDLWNDLENSMKNKRTKQSAQRGKKTGSAPHELIVQRLASEPDHKQTYKPVQPREFVEFAYSDLSVENLKKACAAHFHLPASSCDILVTNKGPSCTNIGQIPHRKDKVYLVRFKVECVDEEVALSSPESSEERKTDSTTDKDETFNVQEEVTIYPKSVSIDTLLQAGELVKPKKKEQVSLTLEKFDLERREWVTCERQLELSVEMESFASGGFRYAYLGVSKTGEKWVIKRYKDQAKTTIEGTLKSNVEDHTRKQVQMHCTARHITNMSKSNSPKEFGKSFSFNRAFYTVYKEEPATVEEFVEGTFRKYINNNGIICKQPNEATNELGEIAKKAETLVHFSYEKSSQKLMLLDLQGSGYQLYDPEIATTILRNGETQETYFCCGNLSFVSIDQFKDSHICNKYCRMLALKGFRESKSQE